MTLQLDGELIPALDAAGRFSVPGVDVHADRILRIQGYSDLERVRPRIRKAAEFAAAMAMDVAGGAAGLRHLAISRLDASELELSGRWRFHSEAFPRYLAGCESVIAFALTAGAAFDAQIDALMHDDKPVEGLFLDSAGWLAVESVTRQFTDGLKRDCALRGLRLTRRMGPGYSYRLGERLVSWGLEQQQELFAALGDAPLPVTLLESSAMQPKMSRSGLYGLRRAS